ncbi:MAG: hypothetical protein AB7O43_21955 [Hyphomicrobiaceae bacterium]
MKLKTFTLAACGVAASALLSAAVALPLTPSQPATAPGAESLVQQVHGCHRDVRRGPAGWHYHTRSCRRIGVAAPRRYRPYCRTDCRYIGPIKTCKRVCR